MSYDDEISTNTKSSLPLTTLGNQSIEPHLFYSKKYLNGVSFTSSFFSLLRSLTPDTPLPLPLAAVLIVISSIQTFSLAAMKDVDNYPLIIKISTYFRLGNLVRELESPLLFFVILASIILIKMIAFIALLFAILSPRNKTGDFLKPYFHYIFFVLLVPVTELEIMIFLCEEPESEEGHGYVWLVLEGYECYSTLHIIFMCITAIPLLIGLVFNLLSALVCSYSHAHNNDPLAHYPWNFEIIYLVLRLILLLNTLLFAENEKYPFVGLLLAIITIIFYISLLEKTCPYYDNTISHIFTSCAFAIITMVAFTVIAFLVEYYFNYFLEGEDVCLLFFIICSILSAKLWIKARLVRLFAARRPGTSEELDKLVHTLLTTMVTRLYDTSLNDDLIQGYISSYAKTFPNNLSKELLSQNQSSTNVK